MKTLSEGSHINIPSESASSSLVYDMIAITALCRTRLFCSDPSAIAISSSQPPVFQHDLVETTARGLS